MLHKEFKTDNKMVQIVRVKSAADNKYYYYLTLLVKGIFEVWYISDYYKQVNDITSQTLAYNTAKRLLAG